MEGDELKKEIFGKTLLFQFSLWIIIGFLLDKSNILIYLLLSIFLVLIEYLLPIKFYFNKTMSKLKIYENKKFDYKNILLYFGCLFLATTLMNIGSVFFAPIENVGYSNTELFLIFIKSVIIASVVEEIIFRYMIFDAFNENSNLYKLILSSVLFSVMHCNLQKDIIAFFAGLVIGYGFIKSNSFIFSVLLHFGINLVTYIFLVLENSSVLWYSSFEKIMFYLFLILSIPFAIYIILDFIKYIKREKKKEYLSLPYSVYLYILLASFITVIGN